MGYYVGAASGGLRTPGYVLSEMQSVDSIMRTLAPSIARSTQVDDNFRTGWGTFAAEWLDFWKANGPDAGLSGWWNRGTTAIYNKTEEFVSRATEWRNRFVAAGGKPPPLAMPDLPGSGVSRAALAGAATGIGVLALLWWWHR